VTALTDVLDTLASRVDDSLADLQAFAAIPSVSAVPAHAQDMERACRWLMERLQAAGPLTTERWATPGHPAVYAEWLGAPGQPTMLVYGHYDVQPPDPLDEWQSPPFTPTVRDGRVYGRGVSDDKGPLLIAVQAIGAWFSVTGRLPVNVKLLFEGEEEVGSRHLPDLVRANAERLRADFVLSADGGMWSAEHPSLTVRARGLTALEFTVKGPATDLHSGRHGGSVHNPLHAISELIAGLHDRSGRVTVDGFYDGVQDRPPHERDAVRRLPFHDDAYLAQTGAPAVHGEAGYSTLERQWDRPTLEVNGLWGGYTGEGSKTVLPSRAHAKLSARLVPGQDPDRVRTLIETHLRTHTPPGVTLDLREDAHGARAYAVPHDLPGLQVARDVLTDLYGQPPLEVGMGGSIPVLQTFQEVLGLHTVFFSFAVGDEDIHAPNEFFRLHRIQEGQRAWASYLARLARPEDHPA